MLHIRESEKDLFMRAPVKGSIGKLLYCCMPDELCRRICAVLLKRFEDTESAILVNGCILVKLLFFRFSHKTNVRNVFHIDLDTLTRILHLLIWLGNIFGIRQLYRHLAASGKHSIQAGDGSGITTLAQLDPERDQTGMLIWVAVGSV